MYLFIIGMSGSEAALCWSLVLPLDELMVCGLPRWKRALREGVSLIKGFKPGGETVSPCFEKLSDRWYPAFPMEDGDRGRLPDREYSSHRLNYSLVHSLQEMLDT